MHRQEAITYRDLYLASLKTSYIRALEVRQRPGEHGSLFLEALLDGETEENDIHGIGENVTLMYEKDGNQKPLFYGVIDQVDVEKNGDSLILKLEAWDATRVMDTDRRLRTFQNVQMTVKELMDEVMRTYPGADYKIHVPDEPIGQLVVQYEETDWEFLKRFFSRFHAALYPDPAFEAVRMQAGTSPDAEEWDWDNLPFTFSQNFEDLNRRKENGLSETSSLQNIICTIKTYDIASLGNQILYKGNPWFVKALERRLENGLLVNHYHLVQAEGQKILSYFNPRINGISIDGTIHAVSRDKVQVQMEIDHAASGAASYWFPYSTVASSSDGSGWYCMPETGESVRVYFPTDDEKEAYVVTNIKAHAPEAGNAEDPMGNPNVRNIQTAQGNQVQFTEEGVLIAAGNGQGSLLLKKSGEVLVQAACDITLSAGEAINLVASNELTMKSQTSIRIASEAGADIELKKGEVKLHGTLINEN